MIGNNENYQRKELSLPNDGKKLLMHSCCAPCAGEILEALQFSRISTTVFFYNPNIHPQEEYKIRKMENIRFCNQLSMPFVDADYDVDAWFDRTKGMGNEPERGVRCSTCFDMRFERLAQYAHANDFQVISSTLGISRWKDLNQINTSGLKATTPYPDMIYWTFNWRKDSGSQRMIEIAKREKFYQQEYCGCVYSLRDMNKLRKKKGMSRIVRGIRFYGQSPQKSTMTEDDYQNDLFISRTRDKHEK